MLDKSNKTMELRQESRYKFQVALKRFKNMI